MRRYSEPGDIEFSNRYVLDERRFRGGRERICNKGERIYEPTAHLSR